MYRILLTTILAVLLSLPGSAQFKPDAAQSQPYGDYTFYSPKNSNKAYLITLTGTIYHTWTFASNAPTGYSSYLLPGGVVLRTVARSGNSFTGGPICGEVQKVDWNSNVIWDYVYSTTTYCSHHDVHAMPNGNVLLIAYESKTAAEVTAAGCSQSIIMWPDKIVEVQPVGTNSGNVVWEWHVWDHLCQNFNSAKNNYVTSIVQHPELLNINYLTSKDWMHVNGVDYNEALDQVVFSSHFMNEFYVIDHSTTTAQAATHTGGNSGKGGDFLYRWGNPAAYSATGTTNFNVVHNAHWVPADCPHANYISAFNNKGGTGGKSCVDMVNPPYTGYTYVTTPGSAFLPATYNWRTTYSGTASQDEGHAQQLPNGNTLITISMSGYVYEIDSTQTVVWSKTIGGDITDARRYTACYVNGPLTVAATSSASQGCPGTTYQLSTTASGGSTYTYSWTSVPPGFTSTLQNPVVTPTASTSYIVNVVSGTCSGADTVAITVLPQPTVSTSAFPTEVCPGGSSQLSATPGNSLSYTYQWTSIPAGFTSTLQNPVVNPIVATTYSVTITSGSCTATNTVTVGMQTQPTVIATAAPEEICPNGTSQLNAYPSGTASYTYAWSSIPAGFTSAIQNPLVGPSSTTVYIVAISANGCHAADSVLVTVDALPATPVITLLAGDSLRSSSATGNQWYSYNALIPGATGEYYMMPGPGTYKVQVTSSIGCQSAFSAPFVFVGVDENTATSGVMLYPNPSTGKITLKAGFLQNNSFEIKVFNQFGQQVRTFSNIFTIDLSDLAKGFYYLNIITGQHEVIVKKIILINGGY